MEMSAKKGWCKTLAAGIYYRLGLLVSDEITGIPVICEYTMSNQVTPSPPVLFEAFPGPNRVISGMVDFL
jgi:hypothetical protein